jgi:hypothetical protein
VIRPFRHASSGKNQMSASETAGSNCFAICQAGVSLFPYPVQQTRSVHAGPSAIPDTGDISQGVAGCEARLDSSPFPGLVCCREKKTRRPGERRARLFVDALAQ